MLHIYLHKAGGLFKMNQLPPSTGRMAEMQRCPVFPWIWLENKVITQCPQLSPHSVPLTPCSISLLPLWAHCGSPSCYTEWEGCEIQCEIQSATSEVGAWCHLLTGGNNESSPRLNANLIMPTEIQENRLRMEGGRGSGVKRLVLPFLQLLAGYQTQEIQLIIIRSIPFWSGVVILIQWPHMWQPH